MENIKPLDAEGLAVLWTQILLQFVKKEKGKGLSTNDLTDELLQKIQSAGTSNFDGYYNSLIGQPQINGITLSGNKTLEDLGITQAITDAIGNVTQISFEVVESFSALPALGELGTFYLVPNNTGENNNYSEYIWDANNSRYELIGTIQSEIDLSNYYTKTEVDTLVGGIQNEIDGKILVNTDTLKIIAKDGICYAYLVGYYGTLGVVQTGIPKQYYPIFNASGMGFNSLEERNWISDIRINKNSGVIYLKYYTESDRLLNDFISTQAKTTGFIQWFYKI